MIRFDSLTSKGKLLLLFISIAIGLFSVSVMSVLNINATKKNLDTIYFGSLVPVMELNEILQIYHSGIASSAYKVKTEQITPDEGAMLIEEGVRKIDEIWQTYRSHFKRDDEMLYVDYTSLEIENTNGYFQALINTSMGYSDVVSVSINEIDESISHIHGVIQKLIRYETDIARYERKKFLTEYNERNTKLITVLALVILIVLAIIYYVFKAIHEEHKKLKLASSKLQAVNKRLENASYTDALTGLYNRRYFDMIFEREMRRARREDRYFTFMMLDIDYFKQYNDTYGHVEGDKVLRAVAAELGAILQRPGDYIFRLGGEEFGILFVDVDEVDSATIAERICEAIEAKQIPHTASKVSSVLTLSLGFVCAKVQKNHKASDYVLNADAMLYYAKQNGRNRYMMRTKIEPTAQAEEEQIA